MARHIAVTSTPPPGPTVLWYGSSSPWFYLGSILAGMLLLPEGIGLIILLRAYIQRSSLHYVIAQGKVTVEYGYWVKSSRELRVADIRSINVMRQGIPGYFGIGSLEFSSAAHMGANIVFWGIDDAEAVAEVVRAVQDEKTPLFVPPSKRGSFAAAMLIAGVCAGAFYTFLFFTIRPVFREQSRRFVADFQPERPGQPSIFPGATNLMPTTRSPVAAANPMPTPPTAHTPYTPAPASFATDVKFSQQAAMQKYPDLAAQGSAFNHKFLSRYQQWMSQHDPRLDRSNWPERLADECAASP